MGYDMKINYCLLTSGIEYEVDITFHQCLEMYQWNIEIYEIEEVDGVVGREDFPTYLTYKNEVLEDCWDCKVEDNGLEAYGLTKANLITLCHCAGEYKEPNYTKFNPYCEFVQINDNTCNLEIITDRFNPEIVTNKLDELGINYEQPVKKAWVTFPGELYSYAIEIEPSESNYIICSNLWPDPNWNSNFKIPKPNQESTWIQDKFLWRYVVRDIVNEPGTPVMLNDKHLPALNNVRVFIENGEFDRFAYQEGNMVVSSFNAKELLPSLNTMISKIERLGYCSIID